MKNDAAVMVVCCVLYVTAGLVCIAAFVMCAVKLATMATGG